ncbi:MAG: TetR family transcriptional regulator [Actinomycetota bacterium]
MSLRERNRRNTLAVTQRTAVEMFTADGFDEVKVIDIAAAVGMAPSTLYRYFPTKEAIVLWDEHADAYAPALEAALVENDPFAALREAFITGLAGIYDADTEFQLQRVTLMYRVPAIHAAAVEADIADRLSLADLVEQHLTPADRAAAELLAGAALLATDWAFNQWQRSEAATPVAELVAVAFDRLGHLDSLR